jgi:serine/threonine protein phosphatase PrpC
LQVTKFCGFTKQGFSPYSKKPNQDSLLQFHDELTNSFMFGTLDGHGKDGHKVSQFITERLPEAVFRHPKYATEPKKAIADAIADVESRMLKQKGSIDCELSGTTFVMGILRGDKLIVANIGDSRIIAGLRSVDGSGKTVAKGWSEDHKPDSPGEKERILAAGGRVFAITYEDGVEGPQRVWLGDIDLPGIAMSRSLGDTVAHTAGVSSEPEFTEYTITDEVECLVIATDGLWEFLSNQEVIDMWTAAGKDPSAAMKFMCDKSSQLWMAEEGVIDDTTILIANLNVARDDAA